MNRRLEGRRLLRAVGMLLALALVGFVRPGTAQPADRVIATGTTVAAFEEAVALAVDPAGLLYVADAGRDVVVQFDGAGQVRATLGGPGSEDGAFDTPADIDPTNGLVLLVADAGNSRLQRFSRSFSHLESLPVGRVDDAAFDGRPRRTYRAGDSRVVAFADGRPIAVLSAFANELFAIDEAQGVVVKWDDTRRVARIIGGPDAGDGALQEPVALASDGRSLFVADRGLAAVVVYDRFGGYVRTLAAGRAVQVQGLAVFGQMLILVLPERLLVYDAAGRLQETIDVALGAPLVDAAAYENHLYLLTRRRLFRTDW